MKKKPYEISPYSIVILILLIASIIAIVKYQNLLKSYDTLATDSNESIILRKELAIELSDWEKKVLITREENDTVIANLDSKLNNANASVEEFQQKIKDYSNEMLPYKNLVSSLDINENELLSPIVHANINGTNFIPLLKKIDIPSNGYVKDFRMIKEMEDSIIYTYSKSGNIILGKMDKTELTIINEINIEIKSSKSSHLTSNL